MLKRILLVSLFILLAVNVSNLTKCIKYSIAETELLGIKSIAGFYFILFWSSTLYFCLGLITFIFLLLKKERKISFFLLATYLSNEVFVKLFLLKFDLITLIKFLVFIIILIIYFKDDFLKSTNFSIKIKLLILLGMAILNIIFFYTV